MVLIKIINKIRNSFEDKFAREKKTKRTKRGCSLTAIRTQDA